MRIFLLVMLLPAVAGCQTLEERLARRVGCNHKALTVSQSINAPGYTQHEFTCEKKKYTCRDAPFFSNCTPGWHRDTVKDKKKKKGD